MPPIICRFSLCQACEQYLSMLSRWYLRCRGRLSGRIMLSHVVPSNYLQYWKRATITILRSPTSAFKTVRVMAHVLYKQLRQVASDPACSCTLSLILACQGPESTFGSCQALHHVMGTSIGIIHHLTLVCVPAAGSMEKRRLGDRDREDAIVMDASFRHHWPKFILW